MVQIVLELTEEQERELSKEAARLGLSVPEYAVDLLTAKESRPIRTVVTGADLVAYWEEEGLIGTRPDITDSASHARKIRRNAERRTQE